MTERKSNAKSVRLSDTVMRYILSYRGDGFNEKFENIILDAMESEEKRKLELAHYDKLIDQATKRYYSLCDKLRCLDPMVQACLHINSRIKQLNSEFDSCISEIISDAPELQEK